MALKKTRTAGERLLTEVELELMHIIWSLQKVSIKEVLLKLPENRNLAYTTVATVVKVLEQKGFLACEKASHAHVFFPLVSREEYENTCIEHMVANVFDGEPLALLQRLLSAKNLTVEDIKAMEESLNQLAVSEKKTAGAQ